MNSVTYKSIPQRGLLVVGLLILGAIFWRDPVSLTQVKALLFSPKLLAINFGFCILTLLLGSLRWVVIAQSLNIPLTLDQAAKGSFIGGLVGMFLPTAAGSDVGRFSFCFLNSGQKKVGMLSIFFDRAWGVASVLLVVGISSFFHNPLSLDFGSRSLLLTMGFSALIFTVFLQFALCHGRFQGFLAQWGMAGIRTPSAKEFLACFILGILNTVSHCLMFKYNADALGIQSAIWPYLTIVPLGSLGSALSFIPFGLGVSQVIFHELFRLSAIGLPAQGLVVATAVQGSRFLFHAFAVVFMFKKSAPESADLQETRRAA